jgi:hypothetical protein
MTIDVEAKAEELAVLRLTARLRSPPPVAKRGPPSKGAAGLEDVA